MAKKIVYGDEARKEIFAGIQKIAAAVKISHGPGGFSAMLGRSYGLTNTNDGITIANEITLSDEIQNIGANLVKQAAEKTNKVGGDGTTTTTVLLEAIVKEGLRYLERGVNPFALIRGLHKAVKMVTSFIEENKQEVSGDIIKQVATISAQDEEIGTQIADIIKELGHESVITVEAGATLGITTEMTQGMMIDAGFASQYFVTDTTRMEAIVEGAAVVVTDKIISSSEDLQHLIEPVLKQTQIRDFVFFADDIQGEALALLVVNKVQGKFRALAIKAPGFGEQKKDALKDIAALTGATLITDETGISFDKVTPAMFGTAGKVVATMDSTTIVGGGADKTALDEYVAQLKVLEEKQTQQYLKDKTKERIAKLTTGVAVIRVGAATDVETKNKKYKIEDALNATKAAIADGIVVGGGTIFLKIADKVANEIVEDKDEAIGFKIIAAAIQYPTQQIVDNTGEQGAVVVARVKQETCINCGYNAKTREYGNLMEMGVIDPVKVLVLALENAASAAATVLTTEVVVADEEEKD